MEAVKELAETRLLEQRLNGWWRRQLKNPDDELCKVALRAQGFRYINQRMLEIHRPLISDAFLRGLAEEVWHSLRNRESSSTQDQAWEKSDPRIITTNREIEVFIYCKTRLAALASTIGLPVGLIDNLGYRDYIGHFAIYYRAVNRGRLLNFYEAPDDADGAERFILPDGTEYRQIEDIDDALLGVYRQRIAELGH